MAPKAVPVAKLSEDYKDFLLVIVTLIAAVTFQAGVSPPGGVDDDGKAIYASQPGAFYVFLISNTIALCTSTLVIIYLIICGKFPFKLEIVAATVAMLVTYASAIFAVTPHEFVRFRYVLTAGVLPFIVRGLILLFRGCKCEDKEEKPTHPSRDGNGNP